ncbi:MAG: phosphatase PAP2 family protein [Thermoanaerobaculia bacterium]
MRPKRRQRFLPSAIGISGGIALASVAFWFFRHQAKRVVTGKADVYDGAILEAVGTLDNESVLEAMELVTHLGSHPAIITATGLTALAMIRKGKAQDAWTVLISTGGALALNSALKAIFQRERPQELYRQIKLPRSHSFPSGHSLLSAATYPIVAHHLVESRSTIVQLCAHSVSAIVILSVGFSRIYFRVHFPSDVLGGFAAGFGWLGLTALSHTFFDRSQQRRTARTRAIGA